MYIGGIEHAILHLLYARFWTKVMRDLGLVKFSEPFTKLLTQGMVLNESFYRVDAENGKKTWYYPHEVEVKLDAKGKPLEAFLKADGNSVQMGGIEKMSKSKNNVIEPKTLVESYGADTARLFTMFAAPPEQSLEWNNDSVDGCARYLRRLWSFCYEHNQQFNLEININTNNSVDIANLSENDKKCRFAIHSILKQASYDFDRIQYNTVVSAAMKLLNALEDAHKQQVNLIIINEGIRILILILYPIVPHITYALWQNLGFEAKYNQLFDAEWPQVDENALKQDNITLTLQVNGKTKEQITVPSDATQQQIEQIAMQSESVIRTGIAQAKKIIVVPNRLVNVVL
jgi:leucyl-tRNA synthetase